LIYQDQDKNNGNLNRRMMARFRRTLNKLEVKEIDLVGKQFTWSNNQVQPTLSRIDRCFYTPPPIGRDVCQPHHSAFVFLYLRPIVPC
jgi:hypothetical protein